MQNFKTSNIRAEAEIIAAHGLSEQEYNLIVKRLGRNPNITELGIFSVMWSEHCSYKSSKIWLKTLPVDAPWVICGPGENAGVIDIGDEQAAVFKMESHNHPSFIEPYQGAATGVGGILRDIFTMGARPIANMNSLRFGDITHHKTRHLVSGVVSGIGGYGNCIGIPTIGGECNFHQAYDGNILVNAMTVGIADKQKIFYSAAAAVGFPVVYVGSKTGRDGIHGATMASSEFGHDSEEKRHTVQVGDTFTEKLVLEACLELMETDAILAIQDMGAAGLTCSSVEMASKGNTGIELHLDCIPTREPGMTPYEIMLSESQERMLMVLKPGSETNARKIFNKWQVDFEIVGKITNTKRMVLKQNDSIIGDIPISPLVDDAPILERPYQLQEIPKPILKLEFDKDNESLFGTLTKLISSPNLCSKRWIWEQYDHMVMADTIAQPGEDASIVRIHGTNKALAIATDCTPRYCASHPETGGAQAVAETWRNLTAVGATPLAITDCLNFGNPERPDIMGQFVGCIKGMSQACQSLNYPVVSGNVSFYNETNGESIMPTPTIGGVGLISDIDNIAKTSFAKTDEQIILIGETRGHLHTSMYANEILGREDGPPPPINLDQERKNGNFVRSLIQNGNIKTCHDISDGGLLVAIAEMSLAALKEGRQIGATIYMPTDNIPPVNWFFGEDQSRYIVCANTDKTDNLIEEAEKQSVSTRVIGFTDSSTLTLRNSDAISIDEIMQAYESWYPAFMKD